MKFLTAKWEHLVMANYSIDPKVLKPFLPLKTEIDKFEGHVFVSLVAFMFNKTKVLGFPIPFHRNFEEVNLRFYVTPNKDTSIRAVTFVKEIVPRLAIPLIANNLFNENYIALKMSHINKKLEHSYSWKNSYNNSISVKIDKELIYPTANSISEFITEHYWGYAKGANKTLEYEVKHPQWKCCEVNDFKIDVDFEATYGKEFSFLNQLAPYNVLYAEGSEVSVSFPKFI